MSMGASLRAEIVLSGKELKSLMRKHKVTIRGLKAKTGFTLKLIRERLKAGVVGLSAIDWAEAITGSVPADMAAVLERKRESLPEPVSYFS